MPRPRSESRQQIVDSACLLLRRQGYQGTGLAQIITASGAPRGSVYYHFPGGKEQIAVEAVRAWADQYNQMITLSFEAAGSLQQWIQLMADHFTTLLEQTDYREGLPITTVTLDSVPESKALTEACRDAYELWLAALARGLMAHGVSDKDADSLALFVLTGLEGAMTLCRAYQSTTPLTEGKRHLLAVLTPYTA